MTDQPTAWGYVRLSQTGRDGTLDAQKQAIREYATNNNLNLVTTRNDGDNTSGFNKTRDGYQLIRQKIRDQELDAIIVRDRARLSRDFDDRLDLLIELRTNEIELHVIESGGRVDVQDVQQAGIECLLAMMDHVKKMAEIERSRQAVAERQERGCYQGSVPFGLRFAEDNCHLEQHPEEWALLEEIIREREQGRTLEEIAGVVGLSTAAVSRVCSRGLGWYEERLEEYSEG